MEQTENRFAALVEDDDENKSTPATENKEEKPTETTDTNIDEKKLLNEYNTSVDSIKNDGYDNTPPPDNEEVEKKEIKNPKGETEIYWKKKSSEEIKEPKAEDVFNVDNIEQPKFSELGITDYIKLGKSLGIDVKENKEDVFKTAYKEYLAKQKSEPDLSKFGETTKQVFEYINNGGNILDLTDPLKEVNAALIETPDQMAMRGLLADGYSQEAAEERLDLMKEGKLKFTYDDYVSEVKSELTTLRDERVKNIIDQQKVLTEKRKQQIADSNKTDNDQLVAAIDKIDKILDLPIPVTVKEAMKKAIETKEFHEELNNAEAMTNAYLYKKFAPKIANYYQELIKSEKRKSFKEGFDKGKEGVFETKPKENNSGHASGAKTGFAALNT